jgi:DnaK suppressor protein
MKLLTGDIMATSKTTKKTAEKKAKSASHINKKPTALTTKGVAIPVPAKGKASVKNLPAAESTKKETVSNPSLDKKLQHIKAILLHQKSTILSEAEVALNELPGQATFPDMGDQASAETDMNFMLRLRGREQRLLKKIDEALERIESGTFGICDDCGEHIDFKRLEARPVTTMCIECKTLQEEEEKRREP